MHVEMFCLLDMLRWTTHCLNKRVLIEPNAGSESVGAVEWLQLGLNSFIITSLMKNSENLRARGDRGEDWDETERILIKGRIW